LSIKHKRERIELPYNQVQTRSLLIIWHTEYGRTIIQDLLNSLIKTGFAFPECAIQTEDNVKVADVVWCSEQRLDLIEEEIAASIAPEICVEVKSASNTLEEMLYKKDLYFGAGAEEVWLCDKAGRMSFYNRQEQLSKSLLIPDFPEQIRRRNQPKS